MRYEYCNEYHFMIGENYKPACVNVREDSTCIARDIPKIGKFKATNSLRVSCLLEFARHGHNLMGVSPHRSLISASVQPTAMVSVVIRHLKEVLGKALT